MVRVSSDSQVVLPPQVVGPSLTVAGLAAWVFARGGQEQKAEQCGELQHVIDTALGQGAREVRLRRSVASRAADLWTEAAGLADSWAATTDGEPSAEWGRHAERLRIRVASLRRLLG